MYPYDREVEGMKSKGLALLALFAVLALAVVVVTGCTGGYTAPSSGGTSGGTTTTTSGSSGGTSSSGMTVTMQNFAFNPSTFTVKVGEVVTFKNADSVDHTVNIGGVDKGTVSPGTTLAWTPDTAGTFPLKCTIHPQMTGTITVQ
jgi:plastocyanin